MQSAVIYYFTGTGNTLALVNAAKASLESEGMTVSTVNVAGAVEFVQADLVGVFLPVYSFGPPRIIHRFLRRLITGGGTPAFVVANAGENAGLAAEVVSHALQEKGYSVRQAYAVTMPSNYILGREAIDDAAATEIIAKAVAEVKARTGELHDLSSEIKVSSGGSPFARLAHWAFLKGLPYMVRFYRYNEKCTGCGACVEICPMGTITLGANERPVWQRGCEHCLRCVNHCPYDAIEVGRLTRGKRRYKYWNTRG